MELHSTIETRIGHNIGCKLVSTGISFGEYMRAEETHLFGKNQTTIFAFIFYTDENTLIVNKDKSVKSPFSLFLSFRNLCEIIECDNYCVTQSYRILNYHDELLNMKLFLILEVIQNLEQK